MLQEISWIFTKNIRISNFISLMISPEITAQDPPKISLGIPSVIHWEIFQGSLQKIVPYMKELFE